MKEGGFWRGGVGEGDKERVVVRARVRDTNTSQL